MRFIKSILNLLFYGNFWIAMGGAAMVLQTQKLITNQIDRTAPIVIFVFCSTWFLYCIHRIVGLQKVVPFQDKGRYAVISKYKNHIWVYAGLGAIGAAYSFFQLERLTQLMLFAPTLLSLGYVIPIFGKKRRLRDFNRIKIFLVAIVWAWVTVVLPAIELGFEYHVGILRLLLERALFIFAITIPFDIRDLKIDAHTQVETIPSLVGVDYAKWLSSLTLIAMLWLVWINIGEVYTLSEYKMMMLSAVISAGLIHFSDKVEHDYYFTGGIDGLMLVQFGLICLMR